MPDVVTFGEVLAALHGRGPLRLGGTMQLTVAGSESNVAIGLARLGHSARWIGRVGNDELGQLALRTLRAESVDVSHSIVDDTAPTGLLLFEQRISDITRVTYYRTGSAGSAITADDVIPHLADATILHATGVTAALSSCAADAVRSSFERARQRDITVSLDVNFRSRLWSASDARQTLRPLLPAVDILFASEDELRLVIDDPAANVDATARRLVDDGIGTVVVKRGEAGATAYSAGARIDMPARRAAVVDVVGAGDAFVAGYLSAALDGLKVAACLDRAVVLGAFAVSAVGDWEALPTRDELHLLDSPSGTTLR